MPVLQRGARRSQSCSSSSQCSGARCHEGTYIRLRWQVQHNSSDFSGCVHSCCALQSDFRILACIGLTINIAINIDRASSRSWRELDIFLGLMSAHCAFADDSPGLQSMRSILLNSDKSCPGGTWIPGQRAMQPPGGLLDTNPCRCLWPHRQLHPLACTIVSTTWFVAQQRLVRCIVQASSWSLRTSTAVLTMLPSRTLTCRSPARAQWCGPKSSTTCCRTKSAAASPKCAGESALVHIALIPTVNKE